jgi:hypothetical protein
MNVTTAVSRAAGYAALASAYGYTVTKRLLDRLLDTLMPQRNWSVIAHHELSIRVPAGWGEAEPVERGGIVIHNRPRHHRIDGDAVWYSSAIELHVRPGGTSPLPQSVTMREHRRSISTNTSSFDLCLRLANGVRGRQERLAKLALSSASALTSNLSQRKERGGPND